MYGYVKGTVKDIEANYVIIDNNNIGYLVYVANPYSYKIDNEYLIYTYTNVKEDELSLYGFNTKEEKEMFLNLISVKGIGPKAGMTILATVNIDGLKDAIDRENILYLTKIPKIGEKAARQIILDLKGKLAKSVSETTKNSELSEALIALGYKQKDINKILSNINVSLSIEDQIKEALKLLLN